EIRKSIPEMPAERRKRYVEEYDLPDYDAMVLTQTLVMSDFFDEAVKLGGDPKQVSNWLMGEVSAYMNDNEKTLDEIGLTPENLTEMIDLIANGTIS
ncbi:Asp-tRNA(Asn)/Glu-tRNA(Gln) amidotransferase GatCAB subunit B, partial [Streptococcus anginosus]|nr:Asp-tRNA(Asn)/Glu-tRNA(Gln) amidotransferase GatCAB subunit B [Streptococcus anginosus]